MSDRFELPDRLVSREIPRYLEGVTTLKPLLLVMIALAWPVSIARAHPHIWIDSRVELLLEEDRLPAVRAHWTFDAFFTQMILMDYGQARNGSFTAAQIEEIRRGAFQNLRHYNYFTMVRVDGREIPVERVENFHAYLDGEDDLVYQFDIPLNLEIGSTPRQVAIAMYDESFFTDILFREDYLRVNGHSPASPLHWTADLRREIYQVPIWGPMNRETVVVEIFQNNR
ncbi:MAG: DUF1007 family protein [Spirochaetaceae bacterium]|nr:MAG: DUF1007 family protein [Spirochaetaceae bacterium]